jgi:hypothetical protein
MQFAVLGAAVVGCGGGGIAALLVSTSPDMSSPRPPIGIASAAPGSVPPASSRPIVTELPDPTSPDPRLVLATSMTTVLARFTVWARDHAGEPCPDIAALDVAGSDPWGHALELTCTAQPGDQMIGVISAGPDGIAGTHDDVVSWALGHEVTEPVRGARWKPSKTMGTRSRPPRHRKDGSGATGSGPVTHPSEPEALSLTPSSIATRPSPATSGAPTPPPASPPAPVKPSAPASDVGTDDIPARRSPR